MPRGKTKAKRSPLGISRGCAPTASYPGYAGSLSGLRPTLRASRTGLRPAVLTRSVLAYGCAPPAASGLLLDPLRYPNTFSDQADAARSTALNKQAEGVTNKAA